MFEKYTEKARRVIFFARYEASKFGSPEIDTEHLLLGIMREAAKLLGSLGLTESGEIQRIREQTPVREKISTSVDLPFSLVARRALEAADGESGQAGHRYIGPEHLLLGLLHEESCLAARILAETGITLDKARQTLLTHTPEPSSTGYDWPKVTGRAVPDEHFRKAVSDALEEASSLFRPSAGPEHLLLGLLRNPASRAAQILKEHGLELQVLRDRLKKK